MAMVKKAIHAVFAPFPVQSHISPAMQLAEKLIAHDDSLQITFVNNHYNHDRIIKANDITNDIHTRLKLVWIEDGLPSDFDYKDIGSRFMEFYTAVQNVMFEKHLRYLLISLTDPAPDVVILGNFSDSARKVAAELNIPPVLLWTQSAAVLNIYLRIQDLIDNGFFPYSKHSKTELISYIPGIPPIEPESLTPHLRIDDISDFQFQTIAEYFSSVPNYSAILINSFDHMEEPVFKALQEIQMKPFGHGELKLQIPPVFPVGPLLPDAAFQLRRVNNNSVNGDGSSVSISGTSLMDEDFSCIEWLDIKPKDSVVYVSFGSLFNPSVKQIRALAMGIKASKKPFLWVVRPKSSLSCHLPDIFPEGFLEESKEDGLIIQWAPQLQVLSHPSIGVFVTHCGWNSTLESISMGVPMITLPSTLDQPTNSKFLTDFWKIGICVAKHQVEAGAQSECYIESKDVKIAITRILETEEGQKMKHRAKALRQGASNAVGIGGTSYSAIAKFIIFLQSL